MGIEPTGDDTRLPFGFEDHEGHQYPIRPQVSLRANFIIHRARIFKKRNAVNGMSRFWYFQTKGR